MSTDRTLRLLSGRRVATSLSGFWSVGDTPDPSIPNLALETSAPGVSQISGTTSVSLAASAGIEASGALAGATSLTLSGSGTVSGAVAITGATTLTLSASATGQAVAAASGSTAITLQTSATLAARGSLAGAASLSLTGSGTLAGAGAMAGSGALALAPSGTITGQARAPLQALVLSRYRAPAPSARLVHYRARLHLLSPHQAPLLASARCRRRQLCHSPRPAPCKPRPG